MIRVESVDPTQDADWRRLSCEAPQRSLFASPGWLQAVSRTYQFEAKAEIASDETGQPRGGVAYVSLADGRGPRTVSFPFTDYCDPLVDDADVWQALVERVLGIGAPASFRILRSEFPLADARFDTTDQVRWHGTAVLADEDEQWASLSGSARRNIRKARRAGVEITSSAELSDLRAFYELHARVRKYKYRLLPQPWAFFEALHEEFAGRGLDVLLARHGDRVIAGVVLFGWAGTLYYKFNASDLGNLEARPNDLLAWESLASARRDGLAMFDWGVSDEDQPGLIRYKQKFASEERVVTALRSLAAGSGREGLVDPTFGPTLGELTSLLTDDRVPDELTERAGEALYRYFA